jgi:hypothetical protein
MVNNIPRQHFNKLTSDSPAYSLAVPVLDVQVAVSDFQKDMVTIGIAEVVQLPTNTGFMPVNRPSARCAGYRDLTVGGVDTGLFEYLIHPLPCDTMPLCQFLHWSEVSFVPIDDVNLGFLGQSHGDCSFI